MVACDHDGDPARRGVQPAAGVAVVERRVRMEEPPPRSKAFADGDFRATEAPTPTHRHLPVPRLTEVSPHGHAPTACGRQADALGGRSWPALGVPYEPSTPSGLRGTTR